MCVRNLMDPTETNSCKLNCRLCATFRVGKFCFCVEPIISVDEIETATHARVAVRLFTSEVRCKFNIHLRQVQHLGLPSFHL